MSRQRPHGSHLSHNQPRRGDGTFISYELSGRQLGRDATSRGRRVVVTSRSVRLAAA